MRTVWDLNLYLLEPHTSTFADAISDKTLNYRGLRSSLPFEGRIYFSFGTPHEPSWAELVRPHINTPISFPSSESVSAVMLIKTVAAFYAFTFGPKGRFILNQELVVPDFGKKVALSIVQPDHIRSADLRTTRASSFQSKFMAAKGVQFQTFGVDTQQDYLRAVTGEPRPALQNLATRVTGADVLQFHSNITFDKLGQRADEFRSHFVSGAYKNVDEFKWIDQLTTVRDKKLITQLDGLMLALVKAGDFEFGPPEQVDWNQAPSFGFSESTPVNNRIALAGARNLLDAVGTAALPGITVLDLRNIKLHAFFQNAVASDEYWSAYDCIEVEVVIGTQRYLLSGGRWVGIAPAFLKDIDQVIAGLQIGAPALPNANGAVDVNAKGKLDEGEYIKNFVAANVGTAAQIHLCPFPTRVRGRTVEFCDVFTSGFDLIHFKIWRCSQTFSALAMQGTNSAEFLMDDSGFRTQCRAAVAGVQPAFPPVLDHNFNARDYRVVFALIRREKGPIPFFSKLTLKRQSERVQGRGFKVAYVVIPVV